MLFRPMSSDGGIHYAVTGWLVNLAVRDFGFKSWLSSVAIILGLFLVMARFLVDFIEEYDADAPPPPADVL
ncbi:hypothetical protein KY285_037098 [Solanum tuberosum]|nr:hypothetical protein KY285_037098 [Solanum tuberosum]